MGINIEDDINYREKLISELKERIRKEPQSLQKAIDELELKRNLSILNYLHNKKSKYKVE